MQNEIFVHNIKCGGCANSIKSKLEKIDGVKNISIDIEEGKVSFDTSDQNIINSIKSTLKKMGYPEGDPTTFESAKSYVSCMIGRMKE